MRYSVISFDLQGTLSDSAFSDEFWFELLPEFYAKKFSMRTEEAKKVLKDAFTRIGKYDTRYYSVDYWLKELDVRENFQTLIASMRHQPRFCEDALDLLGEIRAAGATLVISSSTTRQFIAAELDSHAPEFNRVFSALDDFGIAGKPPAFYGCVAQDIGVDPKNIFHIGDSLEMDVRNPEAAGCGTFYFDTTRPRTQLFDEIRHVLW